MTEGFQTVLAANDEERRDLFVGAAATVDAVVAAIVELEQRLNRGQ